MVFYLGLCVTSLFILFNLLTAVNFKRCMSHSFNILAPASGLVTVCC